MESKKGFYVEIDEQLYDEAKRSGVKYAHIVRLGLLAVKNNPQMVDRLRTGEIEIERLTKKISMISKEFFDIKKEREKENEKKEDQL